MQSMQSWLSGVGKQVVGAVSAPQNDPSQHKEGDLAAAESKCYENEAVHGSKDSDDAPIEQHDVSEDDGGDGALLGDGAQTGKSGYFLSQLRDKALSGLNAASTATHTVAENAKTFAKNIENNSMLGEFDDEQKRWTTEVRARAGPKAAVPPWVGYNEETLMKKQILALSLDTRNFLRDPPEGAEFSYDQEGMAPVALATLEEDPNLKKMRFQLVPKRIAEHRFWRNYFYRVSLIKQSAQLSSLAVASSGDQQQQPQSAERQDRAEQPQAAGVSGVLSASDDGEGDVDAEPVFTEEEVEAVREQLGLAKKSAAGEDNPVTSDDDHAVEQEILSDLNEFELVSDDDKDKEKDLEREIEDLLDSENSDGHKGDKK